MVIVRGDNAEINELTAPEHFSLILQSAQRRAVEAGGSRRKRTRGGDTPIALYHASLRGSCPRAPPKAYWSPAPYPMRVWPWTTSSVIAAGTISCGPKIYYSTLGLGCFRSTLALTIDTITSNNSSRTRMSETPTRIRRDDVYNGLKTALDMLTVVAKLSPIPQIDGVISAVKSILDTVEGAKHNKQACYDVGVKISKLIDVVHTELKAHDDMDSDRGTKRRVQDLERYWVVIGIMFPTRRLCGRGIDSSLSDISRVLSDLAQENAFRRAINRVADADLIQDLNKQVDECFHKFMLGTQLSTAIDVKHLPSVLEGDEAVRMRLTEGLNTAGWRSDRRCLPGTRTRYIDRIWEWIRTPDGPVLCWLNGVAGSGKSAISHELAATLHAKRRPTTTLHWRLSAVRLLAYGLSFVSGLRELVIQALELSDDTRVHPTMEEQFMALIVTPLQEFAAICPETTVVLVIDGVDECPADTRPAFLAAIRAGVLHLPASVKIFLASRPQGDVRGVVEALAPLEVHLAVGAGRDDGDIELYLQRELLRICEAGKLERMWSSSQIKKDAGALSAKAGGLFQWAKLAIALLGDRTRPREMIARILSVADSSGEIGLDALYAEALSIAVPVQAQDKDLRTLYLQVIGTVVVAQEPLTISAISTLLNASGVGCDASTVRTLLENLGSVIVLRRIRGGAVVVRIGHPSFSEYVTSPQRCPPAWYIDLQRASAQLGSRCFSLMAKSLKRDICGMHGPSMTNKDVSSATIYENIITGLRYACGHAFSHISGDKGNWRLLETFLMEKLLEWLEAMSLLGLLDTAVELLRHTLAELEQEKSHTSCVEILQDAIRFIGRFGSVINKSAMNIYFSALPFAPQNTTLYRVYAARYRDIPRVTLGYLESWPEELCTVRNLGGDGTSPRRLAFSADSSRLALSTSTHLVTASPLTGIQLGGKYRLGSTDVELPIALACRPAYLASITSSLVLRTVDARSLKDVQLSLPSTSSSSSGTLSPEVSCAAFNQSVNTLFVGFRDGRVHVWRLRQYSWEPDKKSHPQTHSSAVHCVAASSELFASTSQKGLKIGPFVDSKQVDVAGETLTLTPRCFAEARDAANGDWSVRLSFSATSSTSWACAVSFHTASPVGHSIFVFTSGDQRGRKIFASNSPSYPVYSLSRDAAVLTVICDDLLLRWSAALHSLLEKRALIGVDRSRPDCFPVISPDGHLLALCDEEIVHIRDLMQPPPGRPENNAGIKAAGVILAEKCYVVKAGKEHWLARVRNDGTAEDIVQLGEHEVEHLALSTDRSKLASLSFYQGKTQRGLLEIVDLKSKRRATTTTWPVALHDSFTDWDVCHMEFSATKRHVAIVFFLRAIEASYICACDLESGPRDLWKVDLETMAGSSRHELYSRDAYRMATCYAKFTDPTDDGRSALLEMASRLWNKPPWYTVWDPETVTREGEEAAAAQIKRTAAHLEVHDKNAFGYRVLDNMGQRICCIPEEHCSGWSTKTLNSIGRNRLALVNGDTNGMIVVDFEPMME
ncbi:hypothetical protein EDB84DRAFT_1436528 [Lactarius hengduanensis]|nr:hypothetical protein EDB84DRAFT_1436528 [Lactarius hengduanensis]